MITIRRGFREDAPWEDRSWPVVLAADRPVRPAEDIVVGLDIETEEDSGIVGSGTVDFGIEGSGTAGSAVADFDAVDFVAVDFDAVGSGTGSFGDVDSGTAGFEAAVGCDNSGCFGTAVGLQYQAVPADHAKRPHLLALPTAVLLLHPITVSFAWMSSAVRLNRSFRHIHRSKKHFRNNSPVD